MECCDYRPLNFIVDFPPLTARLFNLFKLVIMVCPSNGLGM